MSKTLSTTFVTDVPFWERNTGAQLRISQLVNELSISPFSSQVLLTQLKPETDLESIQKAFSSVIRLIDPSSPPQTGVRAKTKWYVRALANQIGVGSRSAFQPTFQRYYPQAIVERFLCDVQQETPDILVFEYVNQIQLLRALPQEIRRKTLCVVDTHDVLWRRAQQFREHHQQHWIDVTQKEEEEALAEFDLVIAIQNEEAEYFSSVIDREKIITTGLEFDIQTCEQANNDNQRIVLGLMASNNWTNVETVRNILSFWPEICKLNSKLEFLLAGSICDSANVKTAAVNSERFRLIGLVDSPSNFYAQVDAVWNPVRFGTGLKIKNLEALSFAKCLITSPHGAEGMQRSQEVNGKSLCEPFTILETRDDILSFFSGLNQGIIQSVSVNGTKHLKSHFGAGTQYPLLRRKLASFYSSKSLESP